MLVVDVCITTRWSAQPSTIEGGAPLYFVSELEVRTGGFDHRSHRSYGDVRLFSGEFSSQDAGK